MRVSRGFTAFLCVPERHCQKRPDTGRDGRVMTQAMTQLPALRFGPVSSCQPTSTKVICRSRLNLLWRPLIRVGVSCPSWSAVEGWYTFCPISQGREKRESSWWWKVLGRQTEVEGQYGLALHLIPPCRRHAMQRRAVRCHTVAMRIAELLKAWRHHEEMSVREAAGRVGIAASTYAGIEKGHGIGGETLAVILRWMLEV